MPRRHLGSGVARPVSYRIPRRARRVVSSESKEIPTNLSAPDKELVEAARAIRVAGRAVPPEMYRALDKKNLTIYL